MTEKQHPQKKEVFAMRLSQEDKIKLQKKARENNLSISSYVRTKLLNNSTNEST